ncbi:MAG: hypothetical protein ACOYKD_08460 [Anaerolineaceae bacterium]|jgi:hypothetical protein
MNLSAIFQRIICCVLFLLLSASACSPALTSTPEMSIAEVASPTPSTAKITPEPKESTAVTALPLDKAEATPFPFPEIPQGPTPESYGLPDWKTVQQALLEATKLSGDPNGLCEWEILGQDASQNKVFLWAHCTARAYGDFKSGMAGPFAVYLKPDGSIERVFAPMVYRDEAFNNEFPKNIQKKFLNGKQGAYDLTANLIFREQFPGFPPQAAVAEGKYPVQPRGTLPPPPAEAPRWMAYQSAIAKVWYGRDEDILCEWDYLGASDGYVYLKPNCEPLAREERIFWVPFCRLKVEEDRTISEVICKEKEQRGNGLELDPDIFPQEIREKSWLDGTDIGVILDHLELRRWYPDLPPLDGTELP